MMNAPERRKVDNQTRDIALEARELIRTHIAVCEAQNETILAVLKKQDRMLWALVWLLIGSLGAVAWAFVRAKLGI